MGRAGHQAEGGGQAGVGSGGGVPESPVEAPAETGPGRSPEELAVIAMDVLLNGLQGWDHYYLTEGREKFKELYEYVYGKGSYVRRLLRNDG